jgi:hypothetical protein
MQPLTVVANIRNSTIDPAWANLPDDEKLRRTTIPHSSTKLFVLSMHRMATCFPYLHSRVSKTVHGNKVLPNMKNVA